MLLADVTLSANAECFAGQAAAGSQRAGRLPDWIAHVP